MGWASRSNEDTAGIAVTCTHRLGSLEDAVERIGRDDLASLGDLICGRALQVYRTLAASEDEASSCLSVFASVNELVHDFCLSNGGTGSSGRTSQLSTSGVQFLLDSAHASSSGLLGGMGGFEFSFGHWIVLSMVDPDSVSIDEH